MCLKVGLAKAALPRKKQPHLPSYSTPFSILHRRWPRYLCVEQWIALGNSPRLKLVWEIWLVFQYFQLTMQLGNTNACPRLDNMEWGARKWWQRKDASYGAVLICANLKCGLVKYCKIGVNKRSKTRVLVHWKLLQSHLFANGYVKAYSVKNVQKSYLESHSKFKIILHVFLFMAHYCQ